MAQDQIPEYFITQFDTTWRHLTQQTDSRLSGLVLMDTINGKEKQYNQIGSVRMTEITVRNGATRFTDNPMEKRWLRPRAYDVASIEDEFDPELLGTIVSPTSAIMQSHVYAYNILRDQTIIAALEGTAYQGVDGTTAVPVPTSQKVAVDYVESGSTVNSGLTIAKLRRAKFILDSNNVDANDRYIAVTAQQIQDLLRTTEITSADYNTVRALATGAIDSFLGFKFVHCEELTEVVATDVRTCPVWQRTGLQFADAGRKSRMDVRPDLSHSLQVRSVAKVGATRMEEEKVVLIYCDESP